MKFPPPSLNPSIRSMYPPVAGYLEQLRGWLTKELATPSLYPTEIYITSPNKTLWKLTVDNAGVLSVIKVDKEIL